MALRSSISPVITVVICEMSCLVSVLPAICGTVRAVTALDGGWLHSDRDDPYSSGTLWGAAAGLSTTSGHVSGSFTAGLPLVYRTGLP